MNSNKKYISTIFILISIIILEPFISIKIGNRVVLTKSKYESIKSISDKYSRQEKIINKIKNKFLYKTDEEKIKEGSLRGAIYGFDDPYTCYMSKEEFSNFITQINGSFTGIGIMVKLDKNSNSVIIETVFPNSPAMESGLKQGDQITQIDDVNIDTVNNNLDDIVNNLRGEENTNVKLTIKRSDELIHFNITRRLTEIPSSYSKKIDDVGYIKLLSFDYNSGQIFEDTLNNLIKEDIKKLIIDLRGNPGGLLDETIKISNLFLAKDTLVTYTKNNKNIKTEFKTTKQLNIIHMPIAILVDENTASASELFSAMMQDYKLATIIGSQTYGKGVIQVVDQFKDGSAIKFTISEYFTPKNRKINKIGVKPDIDLSSEMKEQTTNISLSLDNLNDDVCFKKAVEVLN